MLPLLLASYCYETSATTTTTRELLDFGSLGRCELCSGSNTSHNYIYILYIIVYAVCKATTYFIVPFRRRQSLNRRAAAAAAAVVVVVLVILVVLADLDASLYP